MIEGVTRATGLVNLASELGFSGLSTKIRLGTDSSAAKSFVCRRGLGKMRHLEIRDLWLQKEVRDGKVLVEKVVGTENPADLMTKVLGIREIEDRLERMDLYLCGGTAGRARNEVSGVSIGYLECRDWIGLDRIGLDRIGVDWIGLDRIGKQE